MISYFLVLIVMSFLDSILASLWPFDPSFVTLSFVPSLAFMTLALLSRRIPLKRSLILAFCLGTYQDLFVNHTFFLYATVYICVIAIAYLWSKSISSTLFEEVLFVITTVFVKELALYFLMRITSTSHINVLQWFWKRELLTIIVHCFACVLVFRIVNATQAYIEAQDAHRRKGENVKWLQLRLREEKKNSR